MLNSTKTADAAAQLKTARDDDYSDSVTDEDEMSAPARLPIPNVDHYLPHAGEPPVPYRQWIKTFRRFATIVNDGRSPAEQLTASQKNGYLYMFLGAEGRRQFDSDPAADQIDSMNHSDFEKAVATLFSEDIDEVTACFEFNRREQCRDETTEEFLGTLRAMATDCNFGNTTDRQIAIRMICGCNNRDTKTRLLALKVLKLNEVVKTMKAEERARLNATSINRHRQPAAVNAIRPPPFLPPSYQDSRRPPPERNAQSKDACTNCGRAGHAARDPNCPAKAMNCNQCGKPGHFARCCRQGQPIRGRGQGGRGRRGRGRMATTTADNYNQTPSEDAVIRIARTTCFEPIQGKVEISNGISFETVQMEIDSGAQPSTLPVHVYKKHFRSRPLLPARSTLYNFDHSKVAGVLGAFETRVRLCGRIHQDFIHVLDGDAAPVLGRNFLTPLDVKIDCGQKTIATVTGDFKDDCTPLGRHPGLTQPDIGTCPGPPHQIKLADDVNPFAAKLRPVALARREKTNDAIKAMERDGVWEKTDKSTWVHPLVAVPKPDGTIRVTTDLSRLNTYVVPDRYPVPNIKDMFLQISGARHFSKIDLKKAYFNVELEEESRDLTTTITPLGLFRYKKLPMGLKDAASAFQRRVSQALHDIEGCLVYIDDILVFGQTQDEHDSRLEQVLARLEKHDFRTNPEKCEFDRPEVLFLGHWITKDGILPSPKKIQAITDTSAPTTKKQVRSFVGLVNYYRDFVPNLTDLIEPLQELAREGTSFEWTTACEESFSATKRCLSENLKIYIFDPAAPTTVTTDASDVGLGAILSQVQNGKEVPIAFASRRLTKPERNYATNEREALGCVWACEHWDKYLLGRPFTLKTDHQALTTILQRHATGKKAAKFDRYYERLKVFDFTPLYTKGRENTVADALSRLHKSDPTERTVGKPPATLFTVRSDFLATATSEDELLMQIQHYVKTSWPDRKKITKAAMPYYQVRTELDVDRGFLIRNGCRLVVPATMQKNLLHAAHEGHPGIVRMKRKTRETYWWPGLDRDVETLVKSCQPCQLSGKSTAPVAMPKISIPKPNKPGDHYAMDIAGPYYNGNFLICLIDYYSSFPEVLITRSTTTATVVKWLQELFACYGCPDKITTDNRPQFTSDDFAAYLSHIDTQHIRTPVYTPQANGLVEVFNRYMKNAIQTFTSEGTNWDEGINRALAHFRSTAPRPDTQSPASLFLGRETRLPFQLRLRTGEEEMTTTTKLKATHDVTHEQHEVPELTTGATTTNSHLRSRGPYHVGELVVAKLPHRPKGLSPYSKPKRVIEVLGLWTYRLDDGATWNARKLKRAVPPQASLLQDSPSTVHQPPVATTPPPAPANQRPKRRNAGRPPQRFSP